MTWNLLVLSPLSPLCSKVSLLYHLFYVWSNCSLCVIVITFEICTRLKVDRSLQTASRVNGVITTHTRPLRSLPITLYCQYSRMTPYKKAFREIFIWIIKLTTADWSKFAGIVRVQFATRRDTKIIWIIFVSRLRVVISRSHSQLLTLSPVDF